MSHLSYKKLWKRLIDLDLTKTQLREGAGISTSTMSLSLIHISEPTRRTQ